MKYGKIAGNDSINRKIYACFEHIFEKDARSFVRKFAEQPHEEAQVMHTFRELIVGAYLGAKGFKVVSEHRIGSKTPDWCILSEDDTPAAIVELVNFHIDRSTEEEIERHFQQRQVWAGRKGERPNVDRLYSCLQGKFATYKHLVTEHHLPYVVSLHGDFFADVEPDQLDECLLHSEHGLLQAYPEVSGLLYFEISYSDYYFKFVPNPAATYPFHLPDGVF
jgi:hypothetical protein